MRIEISVALVSPLVGVMCIDGGAPRTFSVIFDVLEMSGYVLARGWISSRVRARRSRSTSRSWRDWRLSQNRSVVPKYRARRSAVSALMRRLPCTMRVIQEAPVDLVRPRLSCGDDPPLKIAE